jgi:hypothetical protein
MEKKREDILTELKQYYSINGIVANNNFNCKHKNECDKKCNELTHGMQCHIGTKYGELKIKPLVVSLDCGGGGAEMLDERTVTIENLINESSLNHHMRGTVKTISNLLFNVNSNKESLRYYAMTNACKCCYSKSTNQLPDFFYEQCISYKIKEIEIICPNLIYFQGNKSLYGLKFSNIDDQSNGIFEYLKYVSIGEEKIYAVKCIHPSARGKHMTKKIKFYNEILPEINNYLKDKLN